MKKIISVYEHPPIPIRTHDWCSYYDGEEELRHYGWGRTKEESIVELTEEYPND